MMFYFIFILWNGYMLPHMWNVFEKSFIFFAAPYFSALVFYIHILYSILRRRQVSFSCQSLCSVRKIKICSLQGSTGSTTTWRTWASCWSGAASGTSSLQTRRGRCFRTCYKFTSHCKKGFPVIISMDAPLLYVTEYKFLEFPKVKVWGNEIHDFLWIKNN